MATDILARDADLLGPLPEQRDLTLPPHNLQAEATVLGAVIKQSSSIARITDLEPGDFYQSRNRKIFAAMRSLFLAGDPIDYSTVTDRLQQQHPTDSENWLLLLSELNLATPTAAHIEHYASIVMRCATNRKLISAAAAIAEVAYRDTLNPQEAIAAALAELQGVVRTSGKAGLSSPEEWSDEVVALLQRYASGEGAGLPTDFVDLDKMGALEPGTLTLMGARMGVGKSTIMWQIAMSAERSGHVLYASQEMGAAALGVRQIAAKLGISRYRLRRGRLEPHEWQQISRELGMIAEHGRTHIHHMPRATTADIRAMAMEVQAKHGKLVLIVEDYLQLLGDVAETNSKRRDLDVGIAAQRLREIAEEMDCPVLCAAQLNRDADGQVPTIKDFADSDGPARHADTVWAMHRPDQHVGPSGQRVRVGELDIYLLKSRGMSEGPDKATLKWTGESYVSLARQTTPMYLDD